MLKKIRDLPPENIGDGFTGLPLGVSIKPPIPNLDHKKKMAEKISGHKKSKDIEIWKPKNSKKDHDEGKREHTQPKSRLQGAGHTIKGK